MSEERKPLTPAEAIRAMTEQHDPDADELWERLREEADDDEEKPSG
jgi:hypothetical protein